MADIILSAKSGSDWTHNETDAYNIHLSFRDASTFFGVAQLPAPLIDDEILTVENADDTISDANFELLSLLNLAMDASNPQESAVGDFAVSLFHALGYIRRPRVARTRQELRFLICGESKCATPDVSIIDRSLDDVILLVQEDRRFGGATDAYTQLIAEAIAAYQVNQSTRTASGLPRLQSLVIPGILLAGTSPTFYKVPLTEVLVRCVERGEFPNTPTIVAVHLPDLPRPSRRRVEGMKPLDNRRIILQCYEAFKALIP
ncbi:hypothetical protein FIBSPDRAFT_962263 [Athelia psychrophila]|uniref:Uncharacterized protein n=1 Tax=Athelia psychrophila TaxID=1759441 RepID=A0A166ADY2_9AGAM|nr:hypothetical protein FIBSPDRAFT_962263 [Fibularhizoctonia sp. CBS 109695]